MEARCETCQLVQRKFYCVECLRTHLRDFRSATQHAAAERDAELAKVTRTLSGIQAGRLLRADQARLEASNTEVRDETRIARLRLAEARARAASKREALIERRSQLQRARELTDPSRETTTNHLRTHIQSVASRIQTTETSLANTRKVLIKSLVEAFDLKENIGTTAAPSGTSGIPDLSGLPFATGASYLAGVFGRSASMVGSALGQSVLTDGRRRTVSVVKGEWSIAGLVLPVAGDLRRYTPEHITAAVTHTLNFIQLLTFYLGVKLPFEVTWSGPVPGVGYPSIAAGRGTDHGGWAEWTSPQPLYLISDTQDTSSASSSKRQHRPSTEAFTTGLCMLNYNVAYLSNTQGLDVPLSLIPETLRNLWSVCCINAEAFARASHATLSSTYPLPPPTASPTFTLEFGKVLQAGRPSSSGGTSSSSRTSKHRKSSKRGGDIADEWHLLEIEEGDEH